MNVRLKRLDKFATGFVLLAFLNTFTPLAVNARPPEPVAIYSLRVEYKTNPIGIDTPKPRLSWQLQSDRRNVLQSAYQIQVAATQTDLLAAHKLVWDSNRITSDDSVNRVYEGSAFKSGQRLYWHVRIWDEQGVASQWSEPAFWETGLLASSDWRAKWIEPDFKESTEASPILRGVFNVTGTVRQARAYVTSHGLYEFHLNGQRVGNELFTPGWTSYNKRLQYQTYDVTSLIRKGENVAGAVLGNGWYRGFIGFSGQRQFYGDRLALLAQIEIEYQDGRREVVGTNESWKATTGPILMSEIYNGETYDARLERSGWDSSNYDIKSWSGVKVGDERKDLLVAPAGPPVTRHEEITPVAIIKTPAGEVVADMGQNMVGWVRLKAQGPAGTVITLRHAEVLDKQGNFYTDNLRAAKQTIQYTLKGDGLEEYEPHFTFQGFRYVSVQGYPGDVTPQSLTGIVIHSDMPRAGDFETSNPLINKLQHNIVWGQKGNFLDVPTDCPQRDERLGWTGDAQVFSRTAAFNMDVAGFYTKWLRDVAADQLESGSIPYVIPDVLSGKRNPAGGAAGWADVAVIIPWTMYLTYGDKRLLEHQYESMARWIEYMRLRAGDDYIWDGDYHFGDWLAFATTRPDYPGATTSKDFIATAFFAHSTDLMQRIASILGREKDATRYGDLFTKIKTAFQREYVTERGRVGEDTQTAYVLALQFDLLPEQLRPIAAERLAKDVRARKHLTTGFLGTPYICHVLSRYGYLDEAYLLLTRDQYPSWLYPVKQGATTIWERWDGQKPDGSFQDKGMNSFNHYAYGAVGDWMYEVVAGIDVDQLAPGYKHILIRPHPGGGFTHVKARHATMYGSVSSDWEIVDNRFDLAVEVPANTTATIELPNALLETVTESGKSLPVVLKARQDGKVVRVTIGSGRYAFMYPWKLSTN
ncbi:MAG TPA: glycoside hydrolase family 78 protein [Pyrinomonadaceae bacterium]|jgi:alpha-L-rhamnosidase|nr:glycoside hydrolase family 78 protein [Pyrinomonadaceae bacterium]